MKSINIKSDNGSNIRINIINYERMANGDFYDSNWVAASIRFSIGAFSGNYNLSMLTYEFVSFREQLIILHKELTGLAELDTMEGQVKLAFSGNGRGTITLNGSMQDRSGDGNVINFELNLDQTYLIPLIDELNELIAEYPVIK
jgi:hypothetical protein